MRKLTLGISLFLVSFFVWPSESPISLSIFMASDNDLYPYAKKDLKEISNYFVKNENALDVNLIFERPGKSYQTTNTTMDRMRLKVLDERQERINQRLDSLLKESQDYLILWGHGEGFLGENESDVTGGILFEGEGENPLRITELKSILTKKKVNTLIFDSCLMQTVEVVAELMNETETIIASAQTQDYFGLPYTEVFELINNKHKKISQHELNKKLVETIAQGYPNDHFTISAINTKEFKNQVIPALRKLLKSLEKYFEDNPFHQFLLKQIIDESPKYYGDRMDLGELIGAIQFMLWDQEVYSPKIKNSLDSLWRAINQSTVRSRFGDEIYQSFARETFLGISIWLPKNKDTFALRREEFNNSTLYKELSPYSLDILFDF
jgi:hypothetical protein